MEFPTFGVVLAIGAHPDDIELGCGGTLTKIRNMGGEIHCVVMTRCEDESSDVNKNHRVGEFQEASRIVGAKTATAYDFPNRELPAHSIKMMDVLEVLQEELNPELVLIPWTEDSHQDHSAVALAAIRSFRRKETLVQYEILRHGSHTFTPNLFVDITEHLETKLRALDCYITQKERRAYFDRESFIGLARTRGAQVGFEYAEGFVSYKILW